MNIVRAVKGAGLSDYYQGLVDAGLFAGAGQGYEKWLWKYAQNPACETRGLASWSYVLDGKTVGCLGAIPVELKVGTGKINAAWLVDFFIRPEHRNRGIGRELIAEASRHFDLLLAIGGTDMSTGLFVKMGWSLLGCLPYYIKARDLRGLFREKLKFYPAADLIAFFAGAGLGAFNRLKRAAAPSPDIDVRAIEHFDAEADLLWKQIAGCYRVAGARDFAYLNWKYDCQPGMNYVKLKATGPAGVRGYIILRTIQRTSRRTEGLIVDLVVSPQDKEAVIALLAAADRYLTGSGCCLTRCYVNQQNVQEALLACGFIPRFPHMRFLASRKIKGLEELDSLSNWYLSAGDSDTDRA